MRVFLDGEVTVERLDGPPGEGRFRAADARGEVAWAVVGERFDYLHVIEFAAAGVRRGFHRHDGHRERLYVFQGALRMLARAPGSAETVALELEAGDLATFAPGVAHGFVARERSVAVAFGTGSSPLQDTVSVPDLAAPEEHP